MNEPHVIAGRASWRPLFRIAPWREQSPVGCVPSEPAPASASASLTTVVVTTTSVRLASAAVPAQ